MLWNITDKSLSSEIMCVNTKRQISNVSPIKRGKRRKQETTLLDLSTSYWRENNFGFYNKTVNRQGKEEFI